MERIIALSDLMGAVHEAYENLKSEKETNVSPLVENVDDKKFGIAVVLTDGTVIKKGDVDAKFPIGSIAKMPLIELLLSQYGVDELLKKSGKCACMHKSHSEKPHIPISRHGIRATSAVQPTGDPESKWNLIVNNMIDLMGSAPELNDELYKKLTSINSEENVVDTLAKAGYYLYDDAELSVDLYTRQLALEVTAEQLAVMAATVAADGVNPVTGKIVFDGALAASVTGSLAAHGPHHANRPWLVGAGLPAVTDFGGGIVGVLPGVMGIAAYAPGLTPTGFTVKGAMALKYIMNKLGLSAFGSAKVTIDKNK